MYVYGLYKSNSDDLYYIGITKDLYTRLNGHKTKATANPLKHNYIKKYGCDMKVFWEDLPLEEAEERELFLINWYGTINDGTGQLTNILTEKNPIKTWNKGKKFSKETRYNMSEAAKERNKSQSYIDNQRQSHLDRPLEEIMDILSEWECSDNGLPITKKKILKKYNIKNSRFNWWIQRYRPDLKYFTIENKIQHYKLFKQSTLSQKKYADKNGFSQQALSTWKDVKCPS